MEALKASLDERRGSERRGPKRAEAKRPRRAKSEARSDATAGPALGGRRAGAAMPRDESQAVGDVGIPEAAAPGRSCSASRARVRGCARGVRGRPRGPRGALRLSFRDLAFLRRVRDLGAERVPPRRVRRALCACARARPTRGALSRRRASRRSGARSWCARARACGAPSRASTVFDFAPRRRASGDAAARMLGRRRAPLERRRGRVLGTRSAASSRRRDPDARAHAYPRAVALDPRCARRAREPRLPEHEAGRLADAEPHYRAAVALGPDDATARFDLAVVLDDQRRDREARDAYEGVLAATPTCAEAHFNLARLCERLGDAPAALRHLQAYPQADQG